MPTLNLLTVFSPTAGEKVNAEDDLEKTFKALQNHHNNSTNSDGYDYENFLYRTITDVAVSATADFSEPKLKDGTFIGEKFEKAAISGNRIADAAIYNSAIDWGIAGNMPIHAHSDLSPIKLASVGVAVTFPSNDMEDTGSFSIGTSSSFGDPEYDETIFIPYTCTSLAPSGAPTNSYLRSIMFVYTLDVDDDTINWTCRRGIESNFVGNPSHSVNNRIITFGN